MTRLHPVFPPSKGDKFIPGQIHTQMPWTAKLSQLVVLYIGLTVSSMSFSSPMSTWYSVCCPGLPLEDSGLPSAGHLQPSSSCCTTWWTGVCEVWKSSFHASLSLKEAWAIPAPERLDQAWEGTLTAKATLGRC